VSGASVGSSCLYSGRSCVVSADAFRLFVFSVETRFFLLLSRNTAARSAVRRGNPSPTPTPTPILAPTVSPDDAEGKDAVGLEDGAEVEPVNVLVEEVLEISGSLILKTCVEATIAVELSNLAK
jgi:hypothetical protein